MSANCRCDEPGTGETAVIRATTIPSPPTSTAPTSVPVSVKCPCDAWPRGVEGRVVAQPAQRELHGRTRRPQEADVVVVEQAHVGDAPGEHRRALDAHAEGEPRIPLRVDAPVAQHLGCTMPLPSSSSQPL